MHLSDIHFSHVVDRDRFEHQDVRENLLEDARDLLTHGEIHGIIVAGDIAFSGQEAEYRQASDWLERLALKVACPRTAVYAVPGNHDVNLDRMTIVTKQMHRHYRSLPLRQLKTEIAQLAGGGATEGFLVEKLSDYHAFAASFGCHFTAPSRPLWSHKVRLAPRRTLRILGLTSVQLSDLEDVKSGLVLGANQYIIEEEDCVEHMVVMHHPFEWLKDQPDAEAYINNRARIIIVGHEHLARVQKITNEADCDRVYIESGAVTPPDAHAPYTYHYNLLTISIVRENEEDALRVQVRPRVWSPQATRFVADTGRLAGREVADYVLRCPRFRDGMCGNVPAGEGATPADEKHFVLLRYLFWRYLDWTQRLEVLAGIKALPKRKAAPPSQMMIESMALDHARQEGRLGELWDRMVALLPAAERVANPFTRER